MASCKSTIALFRSASAANSRLRASEKSFCNCNTSKLVVTPSFNRFNPASAVWAAAYRIIGAIADNKSAMLYSLSALTTYGNANISLESQWRMMGALEALNGMLLFGLTTAFLFAMIQRVWPTARR